jgi:organic radical activating enzyme
MQRIMSNKPLKRIEDYDKVLPIVEVYTCVQSEGSRAGYPTICVRTTGCTHRCWFGEGGWCDSAGIRQYIQKKANIHLMILLKCIMKILILKK